MLNASFATQFGAVGYGTGVDPCAPERLGERIGDNPLIVKALDVKGRGDLVVSTDDAAKIAYVDQRTNVVKECRVAFIVNQLPGL